MPEPSSPDATSPERSGAGVSDAAPPPVAAVVAELTAPGARFELETVEIRGVPTVVFRNRLRSLRELAELAVARRGDAELLVFGDERLTYRAFFARANSVARVLADRHGLRPGDRVAILSANNPDWCTTFWGTVNAGGVAVGLNGWWKADEIHYGLTDCGARFLVADRDRFARVADDLDGLAAAGLEVVFVIDPAPGDLTDPRVHDAAELVAEPTDAFPAVPLDEDDPAVILYTSGTTGRPKGAVATHRSWLASTHNVAAVGAVTARAEPADAAPSTSGDVRLLSVPLFHVSGVQAHLVAGLLAGWKLVLPRGRFDPVTTMRLIEDEGVTAWAAVPTMVSRVCHHPDRHRHDLSSVRSIGYGGAPAPTDLIARVAETFPAVTYQSNIYGLTETSGVSTINGGRSRLERPDSVGRALLTVGVEIRAPSGRSLPPGEVGEVCVSGPHLVAGYWNQPAATAEALRDGWLHTGDLGYLDDDGWLYLTDRAKDLIIRGGENISSLEIEDRLTAHPAVAEAAVVGVPHPDLGEAVHAVVQVVPGADVTADELRSWVGEALADFKVPARVVVGTEPLPRTETGKVLKTELRREAAEQG